MADDRRHAHQGASACVGSEGRQSGDEPDKKGLNTMPRPTRGILTPLFKVMRFEGVALSAHVCPRGNKARMLVVGGRGTCEVSLSS